MTVENNKAEISLGEEIPYATVSSAGTQIQFKEALLKLSTTPTVIRTRVDDRDETKIKLVVVVENNSRGEVVNLGSSGAPPAINKRKADTLVLLNEGERLVIGGVTQTVNSTTIRKVPFLGDIPFLGWAFKQRENFETGRELVVFITPSVLKAGEPGHGPEVGRGTRRRRGKLEPMIEIPVNLASRAYRIIVAAGARADVGAQLAKLVRRPARRALDRRDHPAATRRTGDAGPRRGRLRGDGGAAARGRAGQDARRPPRGLG